MLRLRRYETSVPQIIHQIGEVIKDAHKPLGTNIGGLKNLAMTCWNEVIPEHGTETFKKLKSDEIRKGFYRIRYSLS